MYQIKFIKANRFITNLANWLQGKNIVKGATQVNGGFLKLIFCMFERSQKKHNSLDCDKCLWNIFH
jgi:hypothetical protein